MTGYLDPGYGGMSMLKGLTPTREEVQTAELAAAGRAFLARCTPRSQLLGSTALIGLTSLDGV